MDVKAYFQPLPYDEAKRKEFRSLNIEKFDNRRVFLSANAGAGKTHEIFKFVKNHQQYSICLLSYTRSVVKDIKKKMPKGLKMDVMTFDSLCLKNRNALLEFEPPDNTYISKFTAVKIMGKVSGMDNISNYSRLERIIIEDYLFELYEYCRDKNITNVYINKLLMLYKYEYKKYDVMIIDEAQDLDDLKRKFFQKKLQGNKAKIFVGDPKQSLYCENNVFDKVKKEDVMLQLSHTFRYGSELVDMLNSGPCEHHSAFPNKKTKVFYRSLESCVWKVQIVLISAWKHIIKYTHLIRDLKLAIDENAIKDIRGNIRSHHEYLKWRAMWQRTYQDHEMSEKRYFEVKNKEHLLEFSNNRWGELESVLDAVQKNKKRKKGDIPMITTVHRSKGLQYNHVYVHESCFPEHNTNPSSIRMKDNIFYTAITRCVMSVSIEHKYPPYTLTDMEKHLIKLHKKYGKLPMHIFRDFDHVYKVSKNYPRTCAQMKRLYVRIEKET